MAADLVVPAPKTPLMGRSVLPSSNASTRDPRVDRTCSSGLHSKGYIAFTEATLQGGFLPIFWDVPKSTMHAVSDVGAVVEWLQEHIEFGQDSTENLAVLHNQNHMVHEFGLSAWVTQSKRQVISRSVTSCAGMTAYMVVVAQTKVGFLTGGRAEISIRSAALVAFDLQEDELSSDLILSQAAVVARGWADHQEQPVDQNAPEADRRNVPAEIKQ